MQYENRREKEPKTIVLVDYENIARGAAEEGKVVDFERLAKMCRSFGHIILGTLFVPKHQLTNNPWFDDAWLQGFYIIAVPSQIPDREKQYRTADTMMIDYGTRMLALTDVDQIVIISNDADFIPLVSQAKDAGKPIILIAGERVSRALTQVVSLTAKLPMKT